MAEKKWLFFILIFLFTTAGLIQSEEKAESSIKDLIGTWTGYGAGEEVRFRHKLGLLILTVKHKTEFVFVINEKGEVEGEGTITYDLTNNTSGLDDIVAGVHSLMGLAKVPGSTGSALGDKMGEATRDVKGVTKIQYDAPHLKNGPELRHFKFKGTVKRGKVRDRFDKFPESWYIEMEEVKEFTLMNGKPDNTLIAEYEVNRVKTESKFPCWSPFINGPGVIRKGPGKLHIAEFQRKGKNREGKKVWQEFGYVWLARQVSPGKQ